MCEAPYVCFVHASTFQDDATPVALGVVAAGGFKWSRLVCPLEDWTSWDDQAELLHKKARVTLVAEGTDAYLVCRQMNALFAAGDVMVHNAIDAKLICRLFDDVGVRMSFNLVIGTDSAEQGAAINPVPWSDDALQDAYRLAKAFNEEVE